MTPGNIGFFEVHVDDFQRAQTFYHEVFGWEFTRSGGLPYEYYMIDNSTQAGAGLQQGGMRKRGGSLTPGSGVSGMFGYIVVEAIDEALERIGKHGGTVTSPKVLIPAGYFAEALDTEGNPIGVWEVARG